MSFTLLFGLLPILVLVNPATASGNKTIYCFNKSGGGLVRTGVNPICPSGYVKSNLTPPSSPRGVRATPLNSSISVSWSKSLNYGGSAWVAYNARADGGAGVQSGHCMAQALTTCTINGLSPGATYRVYVQAYNGLSIAGMSAPTPSLSITTTGPLPTTTISQIQIQKSELNLWYSKFLPVLTSMTNLTNSFNNTNNRFGLGNAWSDTFVTGFYNIANQIAALPAPYSIDITNAQNGLVLYLRDWDCIGSATYGRFGCPVVHSGVTNYQQLTNLVNQYVSLLKTALNNNGYFP